MNNGDFKANPAYPIRHSGAVIIVGCAKGATEELTECLAARPAAKIMTVNNAAIVHKASFVCTAEGTYAETLFAYQSKFGDDFEVHIADNLGRLDLPVPVYHWSMAWARSGTSSACAALIAKAIGFDEVLLAGVHLRASGYESTMGSLDEIHSEFHQTSKRINLLHERHHRWSQLKRDGLLDGVYSKTGFTGELLGWL